MKNILDKRISPLKNMIFDHIKKHFYTNVTSNHKMSDFFSVLVYYMRLLTILFRTSVENTLIFDNKEYYSLGVITKFSDSVINMNWILLYFASLLTGNKLIIIPSNIDKIKLKNIIINNNMRYIFTDGYMENKLGLNDIRLNYSSIFTRHLIKGIFNLLTLKPIYFDEPKALLEYYAVRDMNNPPLTIQEVDEMFDKFCNNQKLGMLGYYTKGTHNFQEKLVIVDERELAHHLKRIMQSRFWKDHMEAQTTVFSAIPYEYSHILTVLIPFMKNCIFVDNMKKAEVVIEDTVSFENVWKEKVDSIMEGRFKHNIFKHKELQWLFKKLASRNLKRYYNKQTKKEAIIVYNSQIHMKALYLAKDVLPLITTYGTQEAMQLIAFNDFSNKALNQFMCAGEILPNIYINYIDRLVELHNGDGLDTMFLSKDFIKITDNLLFVYGRNINRVKSIFKIPIQLDVIERFVKSFPYVSECQIYLEERNTKSFNYRQVFSFVIEPNVKFISSLNIGLFKLQTLLKIQITELMKELSEYTSDSIIEVAILGRPFTKTIDGLPYQPLTRRLRLYQ